MTTIDAGQWLRNGKPLASAMDRGLQFGDGLFETMAAQGGRIAFLERHLDRLLEGCRRLHLTPPPRARLEAELRAVTPASGRAVIKLIVTAGSGGRGYRRPAPTEPSRYVACFPWPDRQPESLSLLHCQLRLSRQSLLAGIKHCSRLEHVLARREVGESGHDEGLLLDSEDQVVEGVAANIFAVRDNQLLTPALDHAGVAGITRQRVLDLAARWDIPIRVTVMRLHDILDAHELFMCNSLMGVCPVHHLESDQQHYHWKTGPMTTRLQAEINEWR